MEEQNASNSASNEIPAELASKEEAHEAVHEQVTTDENDNESVKEEQQEEHTEEEKIPREESSIASDEAKETSTAPSTTSTIPSTQPVTSFTPQHPVLDIPPAATLTRRPLAPAVRDTSRVSRGGSRTPSAGTSRPGSRADTPSRSKKYAHVTSKIDSISTHKPQGGDVTIFSEKKVYNVRSKIGSLENAQHKPGGGNVKIETIKTNFKETAKPKIDAKSTIETPKSEKKIFSAKLEWNCKSKIGSLDNASHKPRGGNTKIEDRKLDFKATAKPKIGSRRVSNGMPGAVNPLTADQVLP